MWQNHEAAPGRTEETKPYPSTQKEAEFQAPAELTQQEAGPREPEERQVEEEHDPSPEEQDREWAEQRERKEARLAAGEVHAEV